MPLQSNIQLLKASYKDFLRKVAAAHRGDGAGEASPAHYYVERAYADASFEQSLSKLQQQVIVAVDLSELRAAYQARKQRAKLRATQLRVALNDKVTRLGDFLGSSPTDEAASFQGMSSRVPTPSVVIPGSAALLQQQHHQAAAAAVGTAASTAATGATGMPSQSAAELRSAPVASTSASSQSVELEALFGTDGMLRRTVLYVLGNAARAYMTGLNTTTVVAGAEQLAAALERPPGQALITVCNHVAALDDPLVVSALLPEGTLERPEKLRWTLCASDRCFRYAALVPLFRAAKVLPVVRGGGLAQPGMAAAESRLAAGDWVHIFPEGTRSPDGVSLGAVRKGVGRLVASLPEGAPPPLVVPFVHRGMESVMPRGAVLPATGQQVDVMVGEPIPVADLLSAARAEDWPADRLHTALAARVAHGLGDLTARLDARRAGLPDPGPSGAVDDGRVSALDQFDPSDLLLAAAARQRRRGGGVMSAAWERFKFRTALKGPGGGSWALQGVAASDRKHKHEQSPALVVGGGGVGSSAALAAAAFPSGPVMTGASPYLRQLLGLHAGVGSGQRGSSGGLQAGAMGGQQGWGYGQAWSPRAGAAVPT